MTYTIAQLTTLYSNLHMGLPPTPLNALKIQGWVDQNATGGLTDAGTLAQLVGTGDMDVAVAVAAYQYFTNKTPTQAGLTYLINSASNTQDLNDPYYNVFNLENRYINFTFNLGLFGEGAAAFQAAYASLSFAQAVDAAYEKIIGSSFAIAAGLSPTFAKANIVSRQGYFDALAIQNLGVSASAAQKDLAAKAGMIGYIMAEAMKADIGVYAVGINAFMTDLALDGTAQHNVDLVTAYSIPASAINLAKTLTLTSGIDTGAAFASGAGDDTFQADLNPSAQQTLNNGDSIDGGGGTDVINVTLKTSATPASLANIEVFNVTNVDNGAGTSPDLNLLNAGQVTTVKVNTVGDAQGISVTNIQNAISRFEIANNSTNVTFQVKASALAGTSDAAVVTLDAVTAGTLTVTSGAAGSGYETLTLKSTGSNPNVLDAVTDGASDKWTTLKITGDTDLTITSGLADKVSTFDASTFTGKLALGFSNSEVLTVTGGSGDDIIFVSTGYVGGAGATADMINGGQGTDTLQLSAAQALAQTAAQANLTSIEKLAIAGAVTANLDTTLFTGISDILFLSALTGGPTITIDSGDQLTFKTSFASAAVTVGGLGLTDTAKVTLGAGVNIGGTLTTNGVESLTLEVDAGGNALNTLIMTPTAAPEVLKITGGGVLQMGVYNANVIDASAMTGSLFMTVYSASQVSLSGSAQDDQLAGSTQDDIILAGAGDDTVYGGAGVDTIDLSGGGKDTVVLSSLASADRDLVQGFTAGVGAGADLIWIYGAGTTAPTALASAPVLQVITTAPAAPVAFATAVNDVLVLAFDLPGSGGANDLDNFTDGAGLLAALGQPVTVSANNNMGYIVAYQGGSAYVFHAQDTGNATLAAVEIALVGVFVNTAPGALEATNFELA